MQINAHKLTFDIVHVTGLKTTWSIHKYFYEHNNDTCIYKPWPFIDLKMKNHVCIQITIKSKLFSRGKTVKCKLPHETLS